MRTPPRYAVAALASWLVACARADPPHANAPPAPAEPAAAAAPAPGAAPSVGAPVVAAPTAPPTVIAPAAQRGESPASHPRVRGVRVVRIEAARGEDGAGHTVPAVRPAAIELTADAWHGRALDPVLHVGALRFHQYEHPTVDTLRFVAADLDALPARGEVSVQYGDDATSRVVLAPALPVPQ